MNDQVTVDGTPGRLVSESRGDCGMPNELLVIYLIQVCVYFFSRHSLVRTLCEAASGSEVQLGLPAAFWERQAPSAGRVGM